jgi:hypothetical protein
MGFFLGGGMVVQDYMLQINGAKGHMCPECSWGYLAYVVVGVWSNITWLWTKRQQFLSGVRHFSDSFWNYIVDKLDNVSHSCVTA